MSDSPNQRVGRGEAVGATGDGVVDGNETFSPTQRFYLPIDGNPSGPETRFLIPRIVIQPASDEDEDEISPVLSPALTRRPLPSPIPYQELLEVPRRYYTQQERSSSPRPGGLDWFAQQDDSWSRHQIFSPTRPRSDYFTQEDSSQSLHYRGHGSPSPQDHIISPRLSVGSGFVQQGRSSSQQRGEPRRFIVRANGPPIYPQEQSFAPRGNLAQQGSRSFQNRNEDDPFVSHESNPRQHRQVPGGFYQQGGNSSQNQRGHRPPIRPQDGSSQHHRQYWDAVPQEDRSSRRGTGLGSFGQQDGSSPQRRGGYGSSIPRSRSSQLPRGSSSVVQQQITPSQSFGGFRPPIPPDGRSRHPLAFGNLYQQGSSPQPGEDIPPVPRLSRSQYRSFENLVPHPRGSPQQGREDQRLIRRQQSLPQFGTEHRPFIPQHNGPRPSRGHAHQQSSSPQQGGEVATPVSHSRFSQIQGAVHQQSSLPQHGRQNRRPTPPQSSAQHSRGLTHQPSNLPHSGREDGSIIPQQGGSRHPRAPDNPSQQQSSSRQQRRLSTLHEGTSFQDASRSSPPQDARRSGASIQDGASPQPSDESGDSVQGGSSSQPLSRAETPPQQQDTSSQHGGDSGPKFVPYSLTGPIHPLRMHPTGFGLPGSATMPATSAFPRGEAPGVHTSVADLDKFIEERTANMLAATAALKNPPPNPTDAPKDLAIKPSITMGTKLAQFMRNKNPFRKLLPPRAPLRAPPPLVAQSKSTQSTTSTATLKVLKNTSPPSAHPSATTFS